MADVFDKINNYLANLPDKIEKGVAAVTIREVDRYAIEFYNRVKQDAPFLRLQGSIKLERTFKRGRYGHRLLFDGYDENNTPLQMMANVFNTGRAAGAGVAETGRRYAYGRIEGIKFMASNLELLEGINRSISNATVLMQWIVTDEFIQLSDGTRLNTTELNKYMQEVQ